MMRINSRGGSYTRVVFDWRTVRVAALFTLGVVVYIAAWMFVIHRAYELLVGL